jgi:Zn-dependent protease
MPRNFEMPTPIRIDKLTRLFRVRGVDVYVHWTVFLIAATMIAISIRQPWLTLAAGASWLALILLHECGHMIAAQRRQFHVLAIYLYPIHGRCCYSQPWSRFDDCVIAWGGVIAQFVVAVPLVVWLVVAGYSRFDPINAVIAILGGYSLCVAVLNLIPVGGLDGVKAWGIIPEYIKRSRLKKRKAANSSDWRTY